MSKNYLIIQFIILSCILTNIHCLYTRNTYEQKFRVDITPEQTLHLMKRGFQPTLAQNNSQISKLLSLQIPEAGLNDFDEPTNYKQIGTKLQNRQLADCSLVTKYSDKLLSCLSTGYEDDLNISENGVHQARKVKSFNLFVLKISKNTALGFEIIFDVDITEQVKKLYHRLIKDQDLNIINFLKFKITRMIHDEIKGVKILYFTSMHRFLGQKNSYLKYSIIKLTQNIANEEITFDVFNYETAINEFAEQSIYKLEFVTNHHLDIGNFFLEQQTNHLKLSKTMDILTYEHRPGKVEMDSSFKIQGNSMLIQFDFETESFPLNVPVNFTQEKIHSKCL